MNVLNIIALWVAALWAVAVILRDIFEERSKPDAKPTTGLLTGFLGLGIVYAIVVPAMYLSVHS